MEIITLLSKIDIKILTIILSAILLVYLSSFIKSTKIEKLLIRKEIVLLGNISTFILSFVIFLCCSLIFSLDSNIDSPFNIAIVWIGLIGTILVLMLNIKPLRIWYLNYLVGISNRSLSIILVGISFLLLYWYFRIVIILLSAFMSEFFGLLGITTKDLLSFKKELPKFTALDFLVIITPLFMGFYWLVYFLVFKLFNKIFDVEIKINLVLKDNTKINDWYFYRTTYGNNILIGEDPDVRSKKMAIIPKENINIIQFTTTKKLIGIQQDKIENPDK